MDNQAFKAAGGKVCPHCGSDQIEGEDYAGTWEETEQVAFCNACDSSWTVTYLLTGFANLIVGEPE